MKQIFMIVLLLVVCSCSNREEPNLPSETSEGTRAGTIQGSKPSEVAKILASVITAESVQEIKSKINSNILQGRDEFMNLSYDEELASVKYTRDFMIQQRDNFLDTGNDLVVWLEMTSEER